MRFFRRGAGPAAVVSQDEAMVVYEAERLVRPGFTTLDEGRAAIVHDVWARRKAEERSWSGLSDADWDGTLAKPDSRRGPRLETPVARLAPVSADECHPAAS